MKDACTAGNILIALLCLVGIQIASADDYTQAMFRSAMSKDNPAAVQAGRPLANTDAIHIQVSVTPLYVLITLRSPGTTGGREVCVLSSNLQYAIAKEHHLNVVSDAGEIFDIAMASPKRTFLFSNPAARRAVTPTYTQQQLDEVRRLLRNLSRDQLRREAEVDLSKPEDQQSAITKIYRRNYGNRSWFSDSYKLAVAHALLEKGVLVGDLHDTGALYVADEK